ncbi:branched-chain amino acid ABC transporter ATP-binding protein/permease [Rhodomicrobium lacus]|uniref:branched-chain amino acid ABC transporter ATP-binding protein/permease n=1 Tax=Rhodomicrobium lacus TaxID=2498452 RepID=UPI0026E2F78A|nr:ATP-binding cassette domain-containing protein [Rhodomicrobium lacus]WKW51052.1 ATP-binding cassette domain-containing protein [Rhodomicrobium lacus]
MAYIVDVLTLALILVIAVHGYMLIKGLGGLMHLGHAVFYGLGAYAAAIFSTKVLPPNVFPLTVILGALAASLGALLIGWPALKARARYFMIVTFAMQLIFVTLVINFGFTGGPDGLSGIPRFSLGTWEPGRRWVLDLGIAQITYAQVKLLIVVLFAAVSFWFCSRIIRSPYGRLVRAVRDDERVVEAHGRSATLVKLSVLLIGAGLAGAAGALFAHHFNYVGPSQFELDLTMLMLAMLIFGGQFSLTGATIGVFAMMGLLEGLRFALDNWLGVPFEMTAPLRQAAYALFLIGVLVLRPNGLFRERTAEYVKPSGDSQAVFPNARAAADRSVDPLSAGPVLTCSGLHKSFAGLKAVDEAGFSLHPREIVAIIGSNGAGKTTVFNILSGFESADGGEALLLGKPILGLASQDIARLGLGRTFQDVRIWNRLTVIENILAASPHQAGENPARLFLTPGRVADNESDNLKRAWALLERFGLGEKANHLGSELSYAQRKMLSLARITSFAPHVVLLDEPTSGVDPKRLDTFLRHIRDFAERDGRAVCLIEHNMAVVKAVADRVVYMDGGKVLASGTADDVLGDAGLMRRYLGQREAVAA